MNLKPASLFRFIISQGGVLLCLAWAVAFKGQPLMAVPWILGLALILALLVAEARKWN